MYPFPSSTPKFPPLRWNQGSYHQTPGLPPTFRAPLSPPGSPFLARERYLPPLPRGAHSRIAANAPQTQRIGIDADSEYKSGTQKFQARIPPSGPSVSSMPDRKSANAPEGGQAPPVRSRLPSQRHRHAHLLAHPPCRLQAPAASASSRSRGASRYRKTTAYSVRLAASSSSEESEESTATHRQRKSAV